MKILLTAIAALLALGSAAFADSVFNVTSGNWNTAGNWSPSGVPGSGTYVIIGTTGTNRTATISTANAFSSGAIIGDGAGQIGTVNVTSGRTWTNANTSAILVGYLGTGTLGISGGGKVTSNTGIALGYGSGSTGTVTVADGGSELTTSSVTALAVGYSGTGTLTVSNSGFVSSATYIQMAVDGNAKGTLNLNGTSGSRGMLATSYIIERTGSKGATINFNGGILRATGTQSNFLQNFETGDVQILSGGAFIDSNGYNIDIATALQGTGGLTKQGTGMLTLSGNSSYSGDTSVEGGTLQISSGGSVSNAVGYIGTASGDIGTVTVTGSGSQWTSSGGVYVGYSGNGTLNVQSGGKAESSFAIIGELSAGTGTVTVDGAGSLWKSNGNLEVGSLGAGTLNIQNNGKVTSLTTYIGNRASSTSSATVSSSGEWTTTGLLIGNEGTGTLTIQSGGKVTAANVALASSGTAKATVNLNGTTGSRGVLETSYLSEGAGTQGATINFNGGILRATANSADFLQGFETGDVQIQSGGAFFDTNGYNVTIGGFMQFQGTGGITKQGAGTLTLSNHWNYVGANSVESGMLMNGFGSAYLGYFAGSPSSMTVSGTNSNWTMSGGGNLSVGGESNGTLTVQSGGTVNSGAASISSAGTSMAIVTGAGSVWNVGGGGSYLDVGTNGNGTLTVDAAGKVAAGVVTLAETGSSQGVLNLNGTSGSRGVLETASISEGSGTGGGTINFNGGILRATANSADFLQGFESGDVQIQSGGAFFDTNSYNVTVNSTAQFGGPGGITKQGTGTLTLSGNRTYNGSSAVEGGTLNNAQGRLGLGVGDISSMTVSGSGSQWQNTAELFVGVNGNGTLNVQNGSTVSNGQGYVGSNIGSTGTVTVTGAASLWQNTGQVFVGYSGSGTLDIQDGGKVTNTQLSIIGYDTGSAGAATVTGSGSLWQNPSELIVGGSGSGTLTLADGGKATASIVYLAETGNGTGTLNLNGTTGSRAVLETASITEGNGSGGGHITFNGGILRATGNQANFLQNFETGDVQIQSGGAFIDTNGYNIGVSTALQGSGGLNKQGSGTLTLTGASTYTGTTTVDGGTLQISGGGSLTNSAPYDIAAGAVLDVTSGTATLGGDYNSGSDVFGEIYVRTGGILDNRDTSGVGAQGGSIRLRGGVVTGSFDPNAGLLQFADASTLIEGYGTLSARTSLLNTATLQSSGGTLTVTGALGGGGTVEALAGSTLQLNGGNGSWGGVGTLNVSGTAQLGANFSATTTTVQTGGALHLNGNTLTTAVTVASGGAVLSGGGTVAGNTVINGTGLSNGGALVNIGTSTFAGSVTVATDATINAGGGTLNLNGGLVKNGTTSTILGGGTVIVNNTGISGSAPNSDLVVDGTTLVVNAASDYNGPTTVQNSGALVANAAVTTTQVTITSNSTLSGTGSIDNGTGFVFLNGALVVGDTTLGSPVVSQLEFSGTGSTVLGGSSTLAFDLFTGASLGDSTTLASAADRLKLFGNLDATLGGTLVLGNPNAMTSFAAGDMWTLFDFTAGGSITGTLLLDYSSLNLGSGLSGIFDSGTGIFRINAVPEPSRALLLLMGAAAAVMRRRRPEGAWRGN